MHSFASPLALEEVCLRGIPGTLMDGMKLSSQHSVSSQVFTGIYGAHEETLRLQP